MPDKSEILTGAVYPPSGIKQDNILSRNIDQGYTQRFLSRINILPQPNCLLIKKGNIRTSCSIYPTAPFGFY